MKKIEEMKKSNEELKQIAYRANKDGQSTSKTLQADYDKIKFSLKDSEEKRLTLQEESRQLALKFKKMEMDYKNVQLSLK